MISSTGHVLFYGLIAAASPLVLAATLVVIKSERPRTNSIAFLIGFLVGTSIAALLGLVLGQAAVERLGAHETLAGLLALLLGLALIAAGLKARHATSASDTGRTAATVARLGHVRPGAVLSMAALLGFGGPKRLALAFLAMASVSNADLGDLEDLTLLALYIGIATLLVSVLVGIVVIGGSRAAAMIARGESWMQAHAVQLRVWLAIGFGGALVLDAIVRLA